MKNGFFKSFDGTRLFYTVEGPQSSSANPSIDPPYLLFCYGLVCSDLHWRYQMEYFKKHYNVISFDYRGHHRSQTPSDIKKLTLKNIVHDIECLFDELKIPKATVLGHSMGVNLALDFYKRAPHRVESLVLANGCAKGPLENLLGSNLIQVFFPHLFAAYKKFPKLFNLIWSLNGKTRVVPWVIAQLGFNPNLAKKEDVTTYVKMISEMDMIITLQLLKDYETYDATPWLHQIKVPTLIIAGEHDLVVPKEAQELMHQLIPNSHYELIRNGSHCPQMDIPELINSIIERFMGKVYESSSLSESESGSIKSAF